MSGVLVCAAPGTQRPWQGQIEKSEGVALPEHDPSCSICVPGNVSVPEASTNPNYVDTFVFDNDFAALRPEPLTGSAYRRGLLEAEARVRTLPGIVLFACASPYARANASDGDSIGD
jgi:UDPglucose--hexose-1-phosphate uridylyltransferase